MRWLAILALAAFAGGGKARVSGETPEGLYELSFDPKKISRARVEEAILLGPQAVPPGLDTMLEACDAKDSEYKPCGDGSIDAPNFLHNAAVNLKRATDEYLAFRDSESPKELKAVKDYFKRAGAFYVWLLKTRLEFYKTSKLYVLRGKFGDIDADKKCHGSIKRIEDAKNRVEAYKLARTDWHNCVNGVFQARHGKYPKEAWQSFVTKYGIAEVRAEPAFQEPSGRK